jgi:hypothetical protein
VEAIERQVAFASARGGRGSISATPAPNVLHPVPNAAKGLLLLADALEEAGDFRAQGGNGFVAGFEVGKLSDGGDLIRRDFSSRIGGARWWLSLALFWAAGPLKMARSVLAVC